MRRRKENSHLYCEVLTAIVCDKFKVVCQVLNVAVELSDVKTSDRKLFRSKILNVDKRRELLAVVNILKSKKGFENGYVQKGFTYRQRHELSEKRRRGNVTKVFRRMNERGNDNISSVIGGPFDASGVGKRAGGRGDSHGNVQSKVRRNVYRHFSCERKVFELNSQSIRYYIDEYKLCGGSL